MNFEDWMKVVDEHMHSIASVYSDDIADWCYWDSWNMGETPQFAAECALEDAGFELE